MWDGGEIILMVAVLSEIELTGFRTKATRRWREIAVTFIPLPNLQIGPLPATI
jgi:hypothetical protein